MLRCGTHFLSEKTNKITAEKILQIYFYSVSINKWSYYTIDLLCNLIWTNDFVRLNSKLESKGGLSTFISLKQILTPGLWSWPSELNQKWLTLSRKEMKPEISADERQKWLYERSFSWCYLSNEDYKPQTKFACQDLASWRFYGSFTSRPFCCIPVVYED